MPAPQSFQHLRLKTGSAVEKTAPIPPLSPSNQKDEIDPVKGNSAERGRIGSEVAPARHIRLSSSDLHA